MFININIIFSLINFGMLIVLAVYLYYKYGKPILFEYMRSQAESVRVLQLEEKALIEEQDRLKALFEEEQRLAAQLKQKVTLWHNVQSQKCIDEHEALQVIKESLAKKAHIQSEWYTYHCLANRILPQVIRKTQDQLKEQFNIREKQAAYTQEILTFMKKSQ